MKIHVWVPEFGPGVGGIQTFSWLLVAALAQSYPKALISVFSKNDDSFQRNSDGIEFFPFGWWSLPLRTGIFFLELVRHAVRKRPDLIVITHANFSPAALILQRICRIPYLVVGHGIEVWDISHPALVRALREASGLLAVSRFTADRLAAAAAIPRDRVTILPNSFQETLFTPAGKPRFLCKRYGLTLRQPVILTVARLERAERYKGYDQILRALPRIVDQIPDVHYVIVGKGPDQERVRALIRSLKMEQHVTLAGYVPGHELCAHYNLCDVFAMPSKGEGFGIVFLEALACGKPILAGNKDGSVDAVLKGEIGALVDPDNIREIATTLLQLLQKTHPNTTLFDTTALRRRVVSAYGYDSFKTQVRGTIDSLQAMRLRDAKTSTSAIGS